MSSNMSIDLNNITKQSCPLTKFGCNNEHQEFENNQHYVSEQHQKLLVTLARQMTNTVEDENISTYYEKLSQSIENIEDLSEKISHCAANLSEIHDEQKILSDTIDEIKRDDSLEKDELAAMSLNQTILHHDLASIRKRVDDETLMTQCCVFDGTMIWKISNVREKMCDAQSERQVSIYSLPFYTSKSGYKLCIRLYLNGDGNARGTHMSIFLVILRGNYDNLLKWPFTYRVSFCLFDQRSIIESDSKTQPKHIIDSFRPDPNSNSFRKPQTSMNIASGIPKYCPLNILDQPADINRYIINDTMYIKVLIDFIDMPRSIIPFIFNLNVAFPVEIQQKLIENEIKRREE